MTQMQRRLIEIQSILNSILHRKDTGGAKPTGILFKLDDATGDTTIGTPFEKVYALATGGYPVFLVDVSSGLVYQLLAIFADSETLSFFCADGYGSVSFDQSAIYDPDLHL